MSKKPSKKTTSKNAQAKAAKAPRAAKQPAVAKQEGATEAEAVTSRLPPAGTVIKKLDRHGTVRCQCTVIEDGVRYKGHVYRSLSGAAMAAATDLGLKNKTQNGFTFWGLTKPPRKLADPVGSLAKSFDRYRNFAALVTSGATDGNRAQIRSALQGHGEAIEGLLGQVAS